jgi:hypothetical protein
MGECAYFLKADFHTEARAEEVSKELNKFFLEAKNAYNFWQKGRNGNRETFYKTLEKKYPLITEYLKSTELWDGDMHTLSGNMDFGQEGNETLVQGTTVGWGSDGVWHMSNWTPVCNFIKKKFGAIKIVWSTEENGCSSLDSLQLYDWEQIVRDILDNKELHPLLIRTNDELDELLDYTIKQNSELPTKPKKKLRRI